MWMLMYEKAYEVFSQKSLGIIVIAFPLFYGIDTLITSIDATNFYSSYK